MKQERRLLTLQRPLRIARSVTSCHLHQYQVYLGTGLASRAVFLFFQAMRPRAPVRSRNYRVVARDRGRCPAEECTLILRSGGMGPGGGGGGYGPGPRDTSNRPGEEKVRVNFEIRARQIRVIDEEGQQLGIMAPRDAMREAEERGLDLVEVAPKAAPPVCRIMDYGKYRYEQKRRARESRKHQHTVSVKEVKVRPKIDPHDLMHKTGHAREFLVDGNKVKVTVMFRGREMAHPEFGKELLQKIIEATKDIATSDTNPEQVRLEGRNMCLVLTPLKTAVASEKASEKKSGGDGHAGQPAPAPAATPGA